jgi:hypothetical protein
MEANMIAAAHRNSAGVAPILIRRSSFKPFTDDARIRQTEAVRICGVLVPRVKGLASRAGCGGRVKIGAMRTHPCVRLLCIIDTLTSASVLPGIEVIIQEPPTRVARSGHGREGVMSARMQAECRRRYFKSNEFHASVGGQRHLDRPKRMREYRLARHNKETAMLHLTYLLKGLFGFAAMSSFFGFLFHAFTGNPDMALICFVGIGGSAAMAWMFATMGRA